MKKSTKSILCLTLFSLVATLSSCTSNKKESFHTPIKSESSLSPTEEETKWSVVTFGSYPGKEIVSSSWNGIDSYALKEGDILKDDALYKKLTDANWDKDSLIIDGISYIREKEPELNAREQHYRYDGSPYHYFEVEPLRWRVVDKKDNVVTLLSDRTIDCAPFHEEYESVSWSSSSLRRWLNDRNNGFLGMAFNENEGKAIVKTLIENKPNQDYHYSSGEDSEDYVYILSNDEVFSSEKGNQYGFYAASGHDDPAKRFSSSTYAKFRGTWWSPVGPYKGNSFWFMRTSGYNGYSITYICDFGYIYHRGTAVNCDDSGILPVINVDINKISLSQIDEVSSLDIMRSDKGEEKENTCDPDAERKEKPIVSFGQYPQSEVLPSLPNEGEEGIIVDNELYSILEGSNWTKEVIIEGNEYEKLNGQYFKIEPIKWKVLEEREGKSLLFPLYGLDVMPYNTDLSDVYWENSSIRKWLNGDFFDTAFLGNENEVLTSLVANKKNFYFSSYCGEDTSDKVFLLSEEEIFCGKNASDYGFACSDADADPNRQIKPTRYALARGAWASKEDGDGFFMLRTNGYTASNAVYVNDDGNIYNRGMPVNCKDAIVMPAIYATL